MSHEKQSQALSSRTYNYIALRSLEPEDISNFTQFRKKLKHNEKVGDTLFILRDGSNYYCYDGFQKIKSLEKLNKIAKIELDSVLAELQHYSNLSLENDPKLTKLANTYGYPHNYFSKMHMGKKYGIYTGVPVGGLGLAVIALIFVLPLVLAAMPPVAWLVLPFIIVGVAMLGALPGVGIGAFIGSVIGALAAALDHYREKSSASLKLRDQEENNSARNNNVEMKLGDKDPVYQPVFPTQASNDDSTASAKDEFTWKTFCKVLRY